MKTLLASLLLLCTGCSELIDTMSQIPTTALPVGEGGFDTVGTIIDAITMSAGFDAGAVALIAILVAKLLKGRSMTNPLKKKDEIL